ncbi:PREDICTED: transcription factor stalky-like, partial [Rhagoletis zephyria]|uniref:transcription factor stalky-like n=1 Tax=Rhagoletis zephyria TaxID=28612 RepID=UPI00081191B4
MTANIFKMLLLFLAAACLCSAAPSPEPAPEPQPQPQPEPALFSSYNPAFISNPSIYTYTLAEQQPKQTQLKQQKQHANTLLRNDIEYNGNDNSNNNNNKNYYNYASNNNNVPFSSSESAASPPSSASNRNFYYTNAKFSGTPTTATPTQPLPVSGCQLDRLAVYKVVLHTYWTRDLFPKHYPDWRPTAQWTKTI